MLNHHNITGHNIYRCCLSTTVLTSYFHILMAVTYSEHYVRALHRLTSTITVTTFDYQYHQKQLQISTSNQLGPVGFRRYS